MGELTGKCSSVLFCAYSVHYLLLFLAEIVVVDFLLLFLVGFLLFLFQSLVGGSAVRL